MWGAWMDFRIAVPTERSEAFKTSLYRFLGRQAAEDGFAMHWAEPHGTEVVQYVHFASDVVAVAFQRSWASEADDDYG
jgi:hypothetical protein